MGATAEEKVIVAQRRERLIFLRIKGFSSVDATKQLQAEGLLTAPTFDAAYRTVRKDISRIAKKLLDEDGEGDPEALLLFDKEIYIRRLEEIFRNALLANEHRDAITAAERIAAAQKVQTNPKMELDLKANFDLARSAAEAVIAAKKKREAAGR